MNPPVANKTALFDALTAAGIDDRHRHLRRLWRQRPDREHRGQGRRQCRRSAHRQDRDRAARSGAAPNIERQTQPIRDAIETLAYDFLDKTQSGWENNEGAYGDFTFDVAARTITLDYNERRTESEIFPARVLRRRRWDIAIITRSPRRRNGAGPRTTICHCTNGSTSSKTITADFRHRALRHHAEGIFMLERFFGPTITISTGRVVPVRLIGEQHVIEDLGFIPSFADWVRCIRPEPWMGRAQPIHRDVDPFAATG